MYFCSALLTTCRDCGTSEPCLCRNNDSLAIAINKVEHRLTFSAKLIKSAVIAEGIGIVEDTRDFLVDNRDDSFINRKSNGQRRKCVTLFLKEIRQEYAERLKQGMFGCPTYLLLLATYENTYCLSFSYKNVIEITMVSTGVLQRNGTRRKCISK